MITLAKLVQSCELLSKIVFLQNLKTRMLGKKQTEAL